MALFDGLKGAADALRQADKIPQYQAVLDAQSRLGELQEHNHQQAIEIRELTQELERLRADQASAEGCVVWASLLWIPEDNDPYCVHCWDKQKRLFHVLKGKTATSSSIDRCPECKNETHPQCRESYWEWKEVNQSTIRAKGQP
jgi:hypothetical protein